MKPLIILALCLAAIVFSIKGIINMAEEQYAEKKHQEQVQKEAEIEKCGVHGEKCIAFIIYKEV